MANSDAVVCSLCARMTGAQRLTASSRWAESRQCSSTSQVLQMLCSVMLQVPDTIASRKSTAR